jgi:L-ascorbate metabolism protein UlaG (beta-lactamase superfamily)
MRITYVGHATVLIDMDGVRLLTDPVLRRRVAHLRRRGPMPADATRGVDTVLITHAHMDHLDPPSLAKLGEDMPMIVPRGAGPLLRRKKFRHVVEVDEGGDVQVGAVTVSATHAEHEGDRLPFGTTAPCLGYRVTGSQSLFFAGDTDLFDGLREIGSDGLDVALLPIWGWGSRLPEGHLSPATAAEAVARLHPKVVIPIHWGTLAPMHAGRDAAGHSDRPPEDFLRHVAELAPEVEVRVLEPGASTELV